jgi:hypothetical protein
MNGKGYEFCSYDKSEALRKFDKIGVEAIVEEVENLLTGLDLWCMRVKKNE